VRYTKLRFVGNSLIISARLARTHEETTQQSRVMTRIRTSLVILTTMYTRVEPSTLQVPSVSAFSSNRSVPKAAWVTRPWTTGFPVPWGRRKSNLVAVAYSFQAVGLELKTDRLIQSCELFLSFQRNLVIYYHTHDRFLRCQLTTQQRPSAAP
jgi:hypothetical protein